MKVHKDTILIVDDDSMVIKAIQRTLNLHECRSMGTTDPKHALEIIRKNDIAVILSDQKMPIMSGLDLLSKAKLLSPDTVRILITAYSDIDVVISAINEGQIFRYLSKPWKDGILLETVNDSLAFRNETLQQKRISTQILSINTDWRMLVDQLNEQITRSVENSIKALQKIISVRDNHGEFTRNTFGPCSIQLSGKNTFDRLKLNERWGMYVNQQNASYRSWWFMKANILLVDDEQNILNSLQRALMPTAHKIYTAPSGAAALEILTRTQVDLIVSDMRMPGMSGYQLLNKVKELYPSVIRIFLSGYSDDAELCKALMDGSAKMFMSKPFKNDEIVQTIEQLLLYRDKL
jgi:DNA-binding NtrC family response regulator